jgi:hypothetical protein
MAPKICEKLAQGINALCMSEEKADVHFKLSISMTDPKVTKVFIYFYFIYLFIYVRLLT